MSTNKELLQRCAHLVDLLVNDHYDMVENVELQRLYHALSIKGLVTNDLHTNSLVDKDSLCLSEIINRARKNVAGEYIYDLSMKLIKLSLTKQICLHKLISFPDFDFSHDISGILNRYDHAKNEFVNFFSPRCSI